MSELSYGGAAVLLALLPVLPLMMYLRRRGGGKRPRSLLVGTAASLALLAIGLCIAGTNGVS